MSLDEAKKQVGSFWSYLFAPKNKDNFIKNSLGEIISKENIDSYIKELDLDTANKRIQDIFNHKTLVDSNKAGWQDYFDMLKDSEGYIKDVIKNTSDLSKLTGEDLVNANKEARKSTLEHNAAIQQQTLSAKAGQVAVKGLAIAGNMIAMWAITKGIEWAAKQVDELAHSAEKCKERVQELMSSYKSAIDTANSNANKIEELADKYESLSKGVNDLGENVSLTSEEYEEYNSIVNDIADMFPTLIKGYTDEGTAILSLKGNVEQLRNAYKEAQREAYNMLIVSGEDSDGNDILKNWNNLHNTGFWAKLFDLGADDVGGNISTADAIEQLEAFANMSVETYRELKRITSAGTYDEISSLRLSDIETEIAYGSYLYKALGIDGNISDEDFANAQRQARVLAQTYNAEIESALRDVETLANAYLMTNDDYAKLDEQSKNAASIIVNSLNENIVSGFDDKEDVGAYVDEIVQTILTNTDVKDALIGLFTMETSDMPIEDVEYWVNQYITTISNIIGENPIELKVRLGFEDVGNLADNYRTMLNNATTKIFGRDQDWAYQNGMYDEWMAIYDKIDEFAHQYSINTQDEIAAFQKALEEANYDIEKAFESYLHELNDKSSISLSNWQASSYSSNQTYSDLIKDWESQTGELQSILEDIRSGDTTVTAGDIVSQFPDIQPYIEQFDDLSAAVDAFMRDSYDELIRKFGDTSNIEGFSYQLKYLQGILNEGLGGANNVDELIESYKELIDILDQVNKNHIFTAEEIAGLINKYDTLEGAVIATTDGYKLEGDALIDLINDYVRSSNTAISKQIDLTKATIENIKARVNAWGMELEVMQKIAGIYKATNSENAVSQYIYDEYGMGLTSATPAIIDAAMEYVEANNQLNKLLAQLNDSYTASAKHKSGGSSSSASEKAFEETFDWLETAIDRIERSVSNLDLKANSVYRSWSERNSNLKTELADIKKEIDIQASGYNRYMQQAADLGLSEEWAAKIRNGQLDTNSVTDSTLAEQIKQYQDYYEKALKCQDAVESLRESVSKLYETAFDNIVSQFDSIVSVIENSKSMLDEYINQAEERGFIANVAYYEALIKVEQKNIEQLTKERTSLQSALADAVNNGAIAEGSQEWADMVKQINDVTLSIEEANTAMIGYGNSIRDIQWQIFDLIQDRISRISSESDFLINLLSNDQQYDDRGQLTDTGMSTVGLHGMNYNVYMAQADKYAQEMLRIDKELAKDPYNQDLAKRRQELLELQQEMIIAAEDEKQAIVDMVEEGINLELNALKELISTYTEALDAQKDLYDYQKNIAKQTEEIASLQKQLSAYEGDLSEEAKAKVQQIKVSLENAQEQLEETEYERYISDQKKLLDELYLEYEAALNQRLDNIDALIADMIAASNANAGMISDTLSSKADSVGYNLSESMEDIWNTNTGSMLDALAAYDSNIMGGFAEVNTSVGEVIRKVTETVSGIGNVNTTINSAIGSVTANMQAILDKLSSISTMQSASAASSYYGGSGGTSWSGSSSGTAGSNGSGSSGSGGSGGSGFFIYSKDSYPKNKLNKDTSIIDRLRYFDFDYSFNARKLYYGKMGLSGTYTGTDVQNAQMLNWMKLNGYKNGAYNLKRDEWAWTQEGGNPEVILNRDGSITRPDGSVLTLLRQGSSVLNADATKNLYGFMNDPQAFIRSMGLNNIPVPQNSSHNTISNDIQLSIELPNVQNYEQFKYALQHDKQFEKVIQAMTTGKATGGSSLKKYNV